MLTSWLTAAVIAVTGVVDGPGPARPAPSFERAAQPLSVATLLRQATDRRPGSEGLQAIGNGTALVATPSRVVDAHTVFAAWVAPPPGPGFELPAATGIDDPPLAPGSLAQLAALLVLALVLTRRPRHPELPGLPTLPPHVPASPNLLGSVR